MKWYKMDCDAQENLDMRKLLDEWGWEWYGRYYAIIGKIGMLVTENSQTFALQTNNGSPFPVKLLANDLGTTVERLSDFCKYLADNRLIDPQSWYDKNLIYCPKLRERADEYTKKLLTKSRQCPDQEVDKIRLEEEVEEDIYTPVLNQWNVFAKENGLSTILKLSKVRQSGITNRLKEKEFDLIRIFEEIKQSKFLLGNTGWKVDFDFVFCSANNYLKILEGKYRNDRAPRKSEQISRATFEHGDKERQDIIDFEKSLRDGSRKRHFGT